MDFINNILFRRREVPQLAQVFGSTPPMLVLRKQSASKLAQPHVPPAAVITTGVATKKSLQNNSQQFKLQSSVIIPDDGANWFRSGVNNR